MSLGKYSLGKVSFGASPGADSTPDSFNFTDQTGVALSTVITSNIITVTGIDTPTPIFVTNGEYSIDGGSYTILSGVVTVNQEITVRLVSSPNYSVTHSAVLNIGGVTDSFDITTQTAPDIIPDPFNFTDQIDVARNTQQISNQITIVGINTSTVIAVTGGEYSINAGAYTTVAGTVNNNDTVTVRHISSTSFSTTIATVLTVGGISDTFSTTTLIEEAIPDSFSFTDQTDVLLNAATVSNIITVTGINTYVAVSVVDGEYSIDGGSYTAIPDLVTVNQEITVRLVSSSEYATTVSTILTVGGISDIFSVTTQELLDTTPPVITLLGLSSYFYPIGSVWVEPGYTAIDNIDGDITGNVTVGGDTVDTNTLGTYVITYNVSDSATPPNDAVEKTRSVTVQAIPDTTPPILTIPDDLVLTVPEGEGGILLGDQRILDWWNSVTATDETSPANPVVNSTIDPTANPNSLLTPRTLEVSFWTADDAGNSASGSANLIILPSGIVYTPPIFTVEPQGLKLQYYLDELGISHDNIELDYWLSTAEASSPKNLAVAITTNLDSHPNPLTDNGIGYLITFYATDTEQNVTAYSATLIIEQLDIAIEAIRYQVTGRSIDGSQIFLEDMGSKVTPSQEYEVITGSGKIRILLKNADSEE